MANIIGSARVRYIDERTREKTEKFEEDNIEQDYDIYGSSSSFANGKLEETNIENKVAATSADNFNFVPLEEEININNRIEERKAQVEKLEQLKDKLKGEVDDLRKTSQELANNILQEANEQSKKILENANLEAEKILKLAKDEGYQEGYKMSISDMKQVLEEAKKDLDNAHNYMQRAIDNCESDIIDLILSSVNKIMKTKITTEDGAVMNFILENINGLISRENLIVKISSKDFASASVVRDKILAIYPSIKDVEIRIMDSYKSGDVEIESESGVVNPSIMAQFKKLQDEFKNLLPNSREE